MARKANPNNGSFEGEVLRFLVLTKVERIRAFQGDLVRRRVAFPAEQIVYMEELDEGGTRIVLFSGEEVVVEEDLDTILGD